MNSTKSVVNSSLPLILSSVFTLSPRLAWTLTMALEGISLTLPLAIENLHIYSKAAHVTSMKRSSDHLLKPQRRYTKAFSRNSLPLNRTTFLRPFRIRAVLTPHPISPSCLPLSTLNTPSVDLLVAFRSPCFLPLFLSNSLQLECPSLT